MQQRKLKGIVVLVALASTLLCFPAQTIAGTTPFSLNGQPFFPIGLYGYPGGDRFADTLNTSHLQEMSDAGFNVIRQYQSYADNNWDVSSADITAAQNYGLYTLLWMPMHFGYSRLYGDPIQVDVAADFSTKITAIKNNSGLFAYETSDEPCWMYVGGGIGIDIPANRPIDSSSNLAASKDYLASMDLNHPIFYNEGPTAITSYTSTYATYSGAGNSYGVDRYPIESGTLFPDISLTSVGSCLEQIKTTMGQSASLFFVEQGYGLCDEILNNPGRRPVLAEQRFMTYSAIIHGARGVLWYGSNFLQNNTQQCWLDTKKVASEISGLQSVYSVQANDTDYDLNGNDSILEAIKKTKNGHTYFIVANKTSTQYNGVAVIVAGLDTAKVRVLFENRALLSAPGGVITDNFAPWDVHVYTDNFNIKNDFDGDRKSTIGIYSPSSSNFYIYKSTTGYSTAWTISLGDTTDVPVPGDWDGDGRGDCCVWNSTNGFRFRSSSTNFTDLWSSGVGIAGDKPVSGDFDGDGVSEIGVYHPSTGIWELWLSTSAYNRARVITHGISTDIPVPGDWDGDGISDMCVWNATNGFRIKTSSSNFTSSINSAFGGTGTIPLSGDFDGDGKSEIGIYSPSSGSFYFWLSTTNYETCRTVVHGTSNDIPVAGDWDGDGKTDCTVWNPTNGFRIKTSSSDFATVWTSAVGGTGNKPLAAGW